MEYKPTNIGRRAAPRLRLSLPARLVAVDRVHSCVLLNLSRSGAQVAIHDAMAIGEGAMLQCGDIDHFVIVARQEPGLNGLQFDEEISDDLVLDIRRYHENYETHERRALVDKVRKWVNGEEDPRAV